MSDSNFSEKKNFRIQNTGQIWLGVFLFLAGVAALLKIYVPDFPNWVFTWPMLLIVIGLYSGFSSNFKGIAWLVLIIIGGIFLANRIVPDLEMKKFLWPMLLIIVGMYFIFSSNARSWFMQVDLGSGKTKNYEEATIISESADSPEDILDSTSVFSGVKKNILSKNFKGGEVVSIMGGTEINLTQADIHGTVVLETFQLFGGTKLIVPPHWEIVSEIVCIFGGVEDNRNTSKLADNPSKRLILKGTTIFGGLELKSY